jgi:hypothetical protein
MNLPAEIDAACRPLFEVLPMEQAMSILVGSAPKHTTLVQEIVNSPAIASRPALVAGLWLYVDDLDRSHTVSQSIEDATGSYWHGIMHRREGDISKTNYTFNAISVSVLDETEPLPEFLQRETAFS